MKIAATLALFFSIPGIHFAPAPRSPEPAAKPVAQSTARGVWYLAESGHAVYCFGPVVTMPDVQNGLHHVATFCRGDHPMVQLKD